MALSGHASPQTAVISVQSISSGPFTGTVTGVAAGDYAVILLTCTSDSATNTPSSWTVTLGGETLTYRAGQAASGVFGFTAIFTKVMVGSGDLTLSVTTNNNIRSIAAHAILEKGYDTGTPIANSGQNDSHNSATLALTSPNGVTTAANGNVIIGCIAVKGNDTTALSVGAADGSATGQTPGNASTGTEWGIAWDETPTAASVTFAWTWATNSDRPGAAWIEIAAAAGALTVDAPAGIYTLTGHAPTVARHLIATVAAGSYVLTGYAPTITVSANVNVPPGSYALTGYAPQLLRALRVDAPAGSYSLTGFAPSISVAGTIDVPVGFYTLTGFAPVIHKPVGSDATWIGAWATWGALGATWTPATVISVDLGIYSLTGFAPAVTRSLLASAQAGSYTLTGFAPTITAARLISVPAGSYTLTGHAPALVTAGTISVDLGAYTLTGFAPSVLRSLRLDVPAGAYSLIGHAPTLNTSARIDAPAGTYALTGNAPEVRRSLIISVPSGTYTFSGHAPSISNAPPAPRRVALASESRNGVVVLTPVNGAVVAREIIGANDVLDMSGHPIIDMTNSALLGMTG